MNIELYRIFCCVVSTGNILKASELLYISQPAVSRAIMQLEDEIGCKLFIRSSRGVRLTNQGEILYKYAGQALKLLKAGEKKVAEYENLNYGDVTVGVSDTLCKYYLTPYLTDFNTRYPNVKIHIKCQNTPETLKLLKEGLVDISIVTDPIEDGLIRIPVLQIQDCFVTGEKFKQLSENPHHINDLIAFPIMLLTRSCNSRTYIDDYFNKYQVEFEPAFGLGNFDLLVHFAKNNLGIACAIRNFIADELKDGRLFEVRTHEKIPPRNASIAMLKGTEPSPAASELIKMMSG